MAEGENSNDIRTVDKERGGGGMGSGDKKGSGGRKVRDQGV